MNRRLLPLTGTLLVACLVLGSCSIRTAGSPQGDLELTAEFDDVANLVVGHSVQIADVAVGTITGIELVDNRRARVTMSIEDHVELAVGTSANLSKTSLLGEQYVELRPPAPGTQLVGEDELLASGDEIGETSISADFETVTERAIEFLGAISADDIGTLVSTGANAFGGRGADLNELLSDLTTVVVDLDSQRTEIVRTIDGFAQLADDLAAGEGQVVTLVSDLSEASVTLTRNRDRVIGALRGIRDMTLVTNQTILNDHTDELISTIQDLDPILSTLAGQRPLIEEMLDSVNAFLTAMADNVAPGPPAAQAQYIWARGLATPSGNVGEGEPPSGEPPALPDPTTVGTDVRQVLDTLLGFLGDPDLRLPPEVCLRLLSLGVNLDLSVVCGPPSGQPSQPGQPTVPVPLPDPSVVVDDPLGGLGG